MAGRKPDYRLAALNKATEERNNVGAAWIYEDGRISISLNAFVTLTGSKDLVLTLFPDDYKSSKRQADDPGEPTPF